MSNSTIDTIDIDVSTGQIVGPGDNRQDRTIYRIELPERKRMQAHAVTQLYSMSMCDRSTVARKYGREVAQGGE